MKNITQKFTVLLIGIAGVLFASCSDASPTGSLENGMLSVGDEESASFARQIRFGGSPRFGEKGTHDRIIGMRTNSHTIIEFGEGTPLRPRRLVVDEALIDIPEGYFANMRLSVIILHDKVRSIGENAFVGNEIKEMTIPAELYKSIRQGGEAEKIFGESNSSQIRYTLMISDSTTRIEESMYFSNNLVKVEISNSVTSIGRAAFADNKLKSLTIPDSVTSIGQQAFRKNELELLVISSSITRIEEGVFSGNSLVSVEIPDSVTSIGDSAFEGNNLTSVEIPDSVTSIGDSAFEGNNLTSVEIPDSVTSIELNAFRFNDLKHVTISGSLYKDLWENKSLYLIFGDVEYTVFIPDGVTDIEPDYLRSMKISHLRLPSSVQRIERAAFSWNNLRSLEILGSIDYIGDFAFTGNKLESLVIRGSIGSIGIYAFSNNKLNIITINGRIGHIEPGVFANNEFEEGSRIRIYGMTNIAQGMFSNNKLRNIKIPLSTRSIGREAFLNNNIRKVTIPDLVTTIGERAFAGNSMLEVTLSPKLKAILEGTGTLASRFGAEARYFSPEIREEVCKDPGKAPKSFARCEIKVTPRREY